MNVDYNIINEFAKDTDETSFLNSYSLIEEKLHNTINLIKSRNPYIGEYQIFVANEVFSKGEFFSSEIDLFVVFNAVQIELNYQKKKKNAFINNLKIFWKEFANNFKIFMSKKKKKERYFKSIDKKVSNINEYDVEMLYNDLLVQIAKSLYENTNLGINKNKITILGEEEFGIIINIYPVFYVDDEKYKLYDIKKQTSLVIDFKNRFENLNYKDSITNGNFFRQVKIFNNLYWNIMKKKPNQIFIESLIFNCPNELFVENVLETTINLINYLKNSTMQGNTSICDLNCNLFNEVLNTTNYENAIRFINGINFEVSNVKN